MNKRGLITVMWLWTFYIILSIFVYLTLTYWLYNLSDGTTEQQNFESKKLALGVDTILASNNPATLTLAKEDFDYTVQKNQASVKATFTHSTLYAQDPGKNLDVHITEKDIIINGGFV